MKSLSIRPILLFVLFLCVGVCLNAQDGAQTTQDTMPKKCIWRCIIKNSTQYEFPKSFDKDKDTFDISFFGNGDIQKSFEKGEKIPANTGIGITATRYFDFNPKRQVLGFYRIDVSASINVASNVDTIAAEGIGSNNLVKNSSAFGSSILTPLNSGQAVNVEASGYFINSFVWGLFSGLRIKYIGSNRNWKLNDSSVYQVTTNLCRVGLFHDFVPFKFRDKYSAYLGMSYAYNSLRGDLGGKNSSEIRRQFLNSEKKSFYGYEVSFGFRLRNIRADFSYPILGDNNDNDIITGLTGGRVITTISFVGGFNLKLDN